MFGWFFALTYHQLHELANAWDVLFGIDPESTRHGRPHYNR